MQETLMQQGINLMLYGMGTVFVFLTLLVIATTFMSSMVTRFVKEEEAAPTPSAPAAPTAGAVNPTHLAAIKEAIKQHRERQK